MNVSSVTSVGKITVQGTKDLSRIVLDTKRQPHLVRTGNAWRRIKEEKEEPY